MFPFMFPLKEIFWGLAVVGGAFFWLVKGLSMRKKEQLAKLGETNYTPLKKQAQRELNYQLEGKKQQSAVWHHMNLEEKDNDNVEIRQSTSATQKTIAIPIIKGALLGPIIFWIVTYFI